MALVMGVQKATVLDHWFDTKGQNHTPCLSIILEVMDDFAQPQKIQGEIWLTEKSAGMARQQLRSLGFDPDQQELTEIQVVGNEVEIELYQEPWTDKHGRESLSTRVRFAPKRAPVAPPAAKLAAIQSALRAAKDDGETAPPPVAKPISQMTSEEIKQEADASGADVPF